MSELRQAFFFEIKNTDADFISFSDTYLFYPKTFLQKAITFNIKGYFILETTYKNRRFYALIKSGMYYKIIYVCERHRSDRVHTSYLLIFTIYYFIKKRALYVLTTDSKIIWPDFNDTFL